nr:hypothetical protein [Tanacetum cinerariifolium]
QSLNGKPKTGIANPRSGGSILNGENANPNLNNVSRKVDTTQPVIGTSVLEGMKTGNNLTLTGENNTRVSAPNNIEESLASPSFENPNDTVDNIWGTTEVNENHEGPNTKSFVNVVTGTKLNSKINFKTLFNEKRVENSDFVLPMANKQWTPNLNLEKNNVKKVPVWVKIHKVPVVAYSEDGLNLIGTQIDKPVMLDAFTSSMCTEVWGRMGFARALLEVDADRNLKEEVVMAVPRLEVEIPKEPIEASDGFTMVQNRRKKGKNVDNGVPKVNEGNDQKERRLLWHNLGVHHSMVSGMSWTIIGDFNVALNIEDNLTGGSSMTSAMISDHSPAVLKFPSIVNSKPRPFKFFNLLAYKSSFLVTISNIWSSQVHGCYMYQVVQKMKMLKKPLHKLLHSHGNLHDRVNKLCVELEAVQKVLDQDPHNSTLREEEVVYLAAFIHATLDEERFLKQKATVEWLKVGDSNSAYFHKTIKGKNQHSRIEIIQNADNIEFTGSSITDCCVEHYMAFLGVNEPCNNLVPTDLFTKHVSDNSCAKMIRPVTNEEVKREMFDIGDDKSPGPDGYSLLFFKESWDTVGEDVCRAVRDFFRNGKI